MDTSLFLVNQLYRVCSELSDALSIRNTHERQRAVDELRDELQTARSEVAEFRESLLDQRKAAEVRSK